MNIVIIGCGYVGLELGRQLRENGHVVTGVRRSESGLSDVADAGLQPVRADVTAPETLEKLPDADAVVYSVSSGGREADAARRIYVDGLEATILEYGERKNRPDRLLYTSSTGVYGDHDGARVDESTPLQPESDRTRALVRAEEIARDRAADVGIDGTVARLAGLYGPERYRLERYLEGPISPGYLNMVHRDDAAGAVRFLLESDCGRGDVVLVVDDEPVDRWEFADWLAQRCGVETPTKRMDGSTASGANAPAKRSRRTRVDKRCSNDKLRELGYQFKYPTFRTGYLPVIREYRQETDSLQ